MTAAATTCGTRPAAPDFGLYILGNTLDGEVTLSADLTVGNEYGFMFGITDCNGDQSIAETGDQYYLVYMHEIGMVAIERNDRKRDENSGDGGWADSTESSVAEPGESVTFSATYTKNADKVTIAVFANGKEILHYEDSNPFVGVAYGLASKSGEPMKNVSVSDGGQLPPPTGSASIMIAAVATIALAGVVVAARKREQD